MSSLRWEGTSDVMESSSRVECIFQEYAYHRKQIVIIEENRIRMKRPFEARLRESKEMDSQVASVSVTWKKPRKAT